MSKYSNINSNLLQKFYSLGQLGWEYTKMKTEESELSSAQKKICMTILKNEGCSQDDVSKALTMDKSSVAKLISKLMSMDYVRRDVNKKDRRGFKLYLTEKGTAEAEAIMREMLIWEEMILNKISTSGNMEVIYQATDNALKAARDMVEDIK